ncbi:MAG: hypothetical protein E7435_01845 [Ruminococcaceae bacterium]|nr:hypothetical protein [Oscillospiraceae bacterium]
MKRAGKLCAMLCLLAVLSGCGCQKSGPLVTVVEKVEVVSHHGGEILNRTYTKSGKMTAVLNYLRWLRPAHRADCDPEQIPGDDYTITVTLSDGQQEIYRQKTNGYLQKNDGRWENIDPEKGIMLYEIISQMESDGEVPAVGTDVLDGPCTQYRYDLLRPAFGWPLQKTEVGE